MRSCRISKQVLAALVDTVMVVWLLGTISDDGSYPGKMGGRRMCRSCQTINVEIVFDEFEIRNITYNPKFESLEVFNAIGGYMRIYLGASIVTFYDLVEIAVAAVFRHAKKRRKANKKYKNRKNKPWMYDTFVDDPSLRRHRKRKNNSSRSIRNIY
ncbi:hypothetical protein AVEN_31394-1 [Araneus ventricosus]|uniref:Uncharacterized protein n=1 Tax=Araneus ventricosus TaxID=182803 RepID=A0A4Y2F329_ARAVE|nr:hypothetical protein AVEN_31394-1 [Araneus ventricosus]